MERYGLFTIPHGCERVILHASFQIPPEVRATIMLGDVDMVRLRVEEDNHVRLESCPMSRDEASLCELVVTHDTSL